MSSPITRSALYAEGVTLRLPLSRLFPAAFLTFWLCGWLVGEVLVAGILVASIAGMMGVDLPGPMGIQGQLANAGGTWFVLAFTLVWLTFWSFGGFFAGRHLWNLLIGRERVCVEAGQLKVERFRGPLVSRKSWDVHQISAVENDASVVVNGRKSPLLIGGSAEEKRALADAVADVAGVSRPLRESETPHLGPRRRRAS